MIRGLLNNTAPFFLAAVMPSDGGGALYGIPSSTLGFSLLVIMALAFIANQLWTLFDKIRKSIRSPESDTSGLTGNETCARYRREIGRTLDYLHAENDKQDASSQKRFDEIGQSIHSMRGEMRVDSKEVNLRLENLTRAVGELIGRTSK